MLTTFIISVARISSMPNCSLETDGIFGRLLTNQNFASASVSGQEDEIFFGFREKAFEIMLRLIVGPGTLKRNFRRNGTSYRTELDACREDRSKAVILD